MKCLYLFFALAAIFVSTGSGKDCTGKRWNTGCFSARKPLSEIFGNIPGFKAFMTKSRNGAKKREVDNELLKEYTRKLLDMVNDMLREDDVLRDDEKTASSENVVQPYEDNVIASTNNDVAMMRSKPLRDDVLTSQLYEDDAMLRSRDDDRINDSYLNNYYEAFENDDPKHDNTYDKKIRRVIELINDLK